MDWKDWVCCIALVLFTIICAVLGGYYRYIEVDNQLKLHDALESGQVQVTK